MDDLVRKVGNMTVDHDEENQACTVDDKKFIWDCKKFTHNWSYRQSEEVDYFLEASELKETICQSK